MALFDGFYGSHGNTPVVRIGLLNTLYAHYDYDSILRLSDWAIAILR